MMKEEDWPSRMSRVKIEAGSSKFDIIVFPGILLSYNNGIIINLKVVFHQ